jgi:hypothetical protein
MQYTGIISSRELKGHSTHTTMTNPEKPEVGVEEEKKPEMSEVLIGNNGVALTPEEAAEALRERTETDAWREQK